jgi:hypothetical protein
VAAGSNRIALKRCADDPRRPHTAASGFSNPPDEYTTKTPPADVRNPKGIIPGARVKEMPNTGGPLYFASWALALLGALIAGRGVVRR